MIGNNQLLAYSRLSSKLLCLSPEIEQRKKYIIFRLIN